MLTVILLGLRNRERTFLVFHNGLFLPNFLTMNFVIFFKVINKIKKTLFFLRILKYKSQQQEGLQD